MSQTGHTIFIPEHNSCIEEGRTKEKSRKYTGENASPLMPAHKWSFEMG